MIKLKNVTKYFHTHIGKKYILKDVSFSIPAGVNVGILGRNGAGKSTVVRMLGKLEYPSSGKIISNNSFSWPLGLAPGFIPSLSARANIKFVCRLYGKNNKEIKEITDFVKDFSELEEYFDIPIKKYSSGMKGKVNFGLSLAFDFDYLLIDETLSTGDARFRQKAKEALMKKIEECHVLLVSHDMNTLKEICDVGILVNNEKLEYYDKIEDAIKAYELINKKPQKKEKK